MLHTLKSLVTLGVAVWCVFALLFVGTVIQAQSPTVRYIDDNGSDSNNGESTSTPWRTFGKALAAASWPSSQRCSGTLIVMDGTYTTAVHGNAHISGLTCTASTRFTIQNQNERVALISGNGSVSTVRIANSAYIDLVGLRVKGADFNTTDFGDAGVVYIKDSTNVRVYRLLAYENNRYWNQHLLYFHRLTNSLVEDSEFYNFHRHAVIISSSAGDVDANNVVRRVYCHGRFRVDIPGGFPSVSGSGGDTCVAIYPSNGNTLENVIAEASDYGFIVRATSYARRNHVLGSVALSTVNGIVLESAGSTVTMQPRDNVIQNFVGISLSGSTVFARSAFNTQVTNATSISGASNSFGADTNEHSGGGTYSFSCTNCGSISSGARPFFIDTDIQTWTVTNPRAFGNTSAYSPTKANVNYVDEVADPEPNPSFGDCRLWVKAASAWKGAGAGGADVGANILNRIVDRVVTETPLWDPTTGEFPHGAIIAGINDTASTSAYNVHQRLNVPYPGDSHDCDFPAGYASGTPPQNPSTMVVSQGTTSTTHDHTIPANTDFMLYCVSLNDPAGNVGSVSEITSGGQTGATLIQRAVSPSPNAYRAAELWQLAAPTSGVRSQVVTTTGTVVSMITTSIEAEGYSAVGGSAAANGSSPTPSVTVSTNTNETIYDCLNATTGNLTAGADQTLQKDTPHATVAFRNAVSTQSGTNGGVMSHTTPSARWGSAAVSMVPTSPDPPPDPLPTLDVTKYRIYSGFGVNTVSTPLADLNTLASVSPTGMARIRTEVTAKNNSSTPVGIVLFCRKNADGYTQAMDTFGSNVFRLYGAGVDPHIPSSLTTISGELTAPDSNTVAGAFIRDTASLFVTPTLAVDKRFEMEWLVVFNATAGDTINCRPHKDNGAALDTYTVTPTINIVPPSASGFASLPRQPWGMIATPNPSAALRRLAGRPELVRRSSW